MLFDCHMCCTTCVLYNINAALHHMQSHKRTALAAAGKLQRSIILPRLHAQDNGATYIGCTSWRVKHLDRTQQPSNQRGRW